MIKIAFIPYKITAEANVPPKIAVEGHIPKTGTTAGGLLRDLPRCQDGSGEQQAICRGPDSWHVAFRGDFAQHVGFCSDFARQICYFYHFVHLEGHFCYFIFKSTK